MAKLIPLNEIPRAARDAERVARVRHETREAALAAASHEIVEAPGTYSGAFPASHGWCCTRVAADAVSAASVVRMPGGTQHRLFAVRSEVES